MGMVAFLVAQGSVTNMRSHLAPLSEGASRLIFPPKSDRGHHVPAVSGHAACASAVTDASASATAYQRIEPCSCTARSAKRWENAWSPGWSRGFLLLGSASPDMIQAVSKSLTGRIRFVDVSGFSMQETGTGSRTWNASELAPSMHIVKKDLQLDHLWVLYPGEQEYPLTESITAFPLRDVGKLVLEPG